MREEYDIVVVGAGPAGCTASWFIAKKEFSVLLVEKKRKVGSPVTCAEALRNDTRNIIPLPDYIIDHQLSNEVIYRNDVKISENKITGLMVNRAELDRYLASKAVSEGAELSIGTTFKKFKKDGGKVVVSMKKHGKIKDVKCKILIGADGFGSRVAKMARLKSELQSSDYAVTYQYYMSNILTEEDTAYFFFHIPYISEGYAWIFPKRSGTANVGLGMRSHQEISPREVLNLFLNENPVAHSKCQNACPLGQSASSVYTGGPHKRIVDDHLMVIGEAAGHVHPWTGEGNYFAILGGKIVSEVCRKAFNKEDFSRRFLRRHEVECDKAFARKLRLALEEQFYAKLE